MTAARRAGTDGKADAFNYTGALSQEIEIAGQRGARRRSAEADRDARAFDVVATQRRTAARAYAAYFDVVAGREAVEVSRRLEATAQKIARVAAARAEAGAGSALDAEIMSAASLRVVQGRLAAERDLAARSADLVALLGRDPTRDAANVSVGGTLEPLAGSDALLSSTARIAEERPDVRALERDQRAFEERAEALRRSRVPSLTLQIFAQNDGYNERVFGGGLALPIPLPEPVGRLNAGAIAEAEANARKSAAEARALGRELSVELASAIAEYRTRKAESDLYTDERATRSETILGELGKEIEAGRLPVRDAIVAQQQLIEVLRARIEARRALCIASVDLALAAGVALEGGGR